MIKMQLLKVMKICNLVGPHLFQQTAERICAAERFVTKYIEAFAVINKEEINLNKLRESRATIDTKLKQWSSGRLYWK